MAQLKEETRGRVTVIVESDIEDGAGSTQRSVN